MKKVLSLVLALVMIALCFASCTDNNAASGDVTVIKVWSSSGSTQERMEQLVEEFNNTTGKEEGIKIQFEVYLNDYATIIESASQNDQLPHLLMWGGDQAKVNAANKGYILPIAEMPGGQEFLDTYGEIPLANRELINGKVYFVNMAQTVQGLIYNKDLFKKAGLVDENGEPTPPKTTSELVEYAKILTDKANNVFGYGLPLKDQGWSQIAYPVNATFGDISPNGATTKIDWENETYSFTDHWLEYIDFVKAVKNSDALFPGAESLDNDTMRAQFAAGRIGMFMGASWDVGVLTDQFPATCEWAVAPVPVFDGYERFQNPSSRSSGYCIANTAKECPEKVMVVYKWLLGDEVCLDLYEKGFYVPIRAGVSDKADETKFPVQWAQFANLVKDQKVERTPSPSLALEKDSAATKAQYVWQDPSIDASKYIPELNDTYTQALRKGIKDGTIDKAIFVK